MKIFPKYILLVLFGFFLPSCVDKNQDDNMNSEDILIPENSFLKDKDIDGDKIADEIIFVYTEGAHCCYRLTIVLSTDTCRFEFPFEMDGGYINGPDDSQPQHFNIMDYDQDGKDEIYIVIETYNGKPNPLLKVWEEQYGIVSHNLIIDFNDSLVIISVPPFISIEQFYLHKEISALSSQMFAFKKGKDDNTLKYGFKNEIGEVVILPVLDSVTEFSLQTAIVYLNGDPILINKQGRIIHSFNNFKLIDSQVNNDWPILVSNDVISEYFFISIDGNLLNATPYQDAKSFTEGIAAVESDNEWGYIDTGNSWVISPQFKHAHPFKDGKALVELEDTMIWIDKSGKPVK